MNEKKKELLISPDSTIREAMAVINKVPLGIVMLVDDQEKLLSVVTDGDIRRALVEGVSLDSSIKEIITTNPTVLKKGYTKNQALRLFSNIIRQIPVVNDEGKVVNLLVYSEFTDQLPQGKKVVVRGRAPLRISFAGGGTDVNSYIEAKGGLVLSTTMNKYCFGTLRKRPDEKITIHSKDYDLSLELDHIKAIEYDGQLDLIKAVIRLMQPVYGFDLYLHSDVPPGTGLGGSAAIASLVAGLLNHLRESKLSEYELAEIAFQAERVELGVAGGWQDQYAAVFGGFNYIEFKADDMIVHPLKIKEEILNELESNLLLCFTGKTRVSGDIVKSQNEAFLARDKVVTEALDKTSGYTIRMKNVLLKGKLAEFGKLLHEAWLVKKQFDKKVTDEFIDQLYETGLKAGALGGKLLGAGAGGYILFFCPHLKKAEIAKALVGAGGEIMDFNFDFRGLQTWNVEDEFLKGLTNKKNGVK